jgi:hypothetical protein
MDIAQQSRLLSPENPPETAQGNQIAMKVAKFVMKSSYSNELNAFVL